MKKHIHTYIYMCEHTHTDSRSNRSIDRNYTINFTTAFSKHPWLSCQSTGHKVVGRDWQHPAQLQVVQVSMNSKWKKILTPTISLGCERKLITKETKNSVFKENHPNVSFSGFHWRHFHSRSLKPLLGFIRFSRHWHPLKLIWITLHLDLLIWQTLLSKATLSEGQH